MEFTKLLEERRSIRAFDPEKHVTAEQIQEIVQAAIQAPSWKNSQTTRYYALVTPEKVEEIHTAFVDGKRCLVIPMEDDEEAKINGETMSF